MPKLRIHLCQKKWTQWFLTKSVKGILKELCTGLCYLPFPNCLYCTYHSTTLLRLLIVIRNLCLECSLPHSLLLCWEVLMHSQAHRQSKRSVSHQLSLALQQPVSLGTALMREQGESFHLQHPPERAMSVCWTPALQLRKFSLRGHSGDRGQCLCLEGREDPSLETAALWSLVSFPLSLLFSLPFSRSFLLSLPAFSSLHLLFTLSLCPLYATLLPYFLSFLLSFSHFLLSILFFLPSCLSLSFFLSFLSPSFPTLPSFFLSTSSTFC